MLASTPSRVGLAFVLVGVWSAILGQQAPLIDAPILSFPGAVPSSLGVRTDGGLGTLADLDGDGDDDLVNCWIQSPLSGGGTSSTIAVLQLRINDGLGNFTSSSSLIINPLPLPLNSTVGPRFVLLRPANLNGDNREDFVVAFESELRGYVSNGVAAPPSLLFTLPASSRVNFIEVGDYDGNGLDDVASALILQSIDLHFTQANGSVNSVIAAASIPGLNGIASIDGNGDGITDLASVDVGGTGRIQAWLQNTLTTVATWNYPSSGLRGLAIGDVDNDGDQDLAGLLANFGVGPAFRIDHYVVRQGPSATFVAQPSVPAGVQGSLTGSLIILGDDDNDGDLDLFCTVNNALFTTRNTGGSFGAMVGGDTIAGTPFPEVRDLNGDGSDDLLFANRIFYGRNGRTWLSETIPRGTGMSGAVQAGDFDGDGDIDLGAGVLSSSTVPMPVRALVNDGSGNMTPATRVVIGTPPGLAYSPGGLPIDLDGDGDLDQLVDVGTNSNFPVATRRLINQGGGTYLDQGPAFSPSLALGVASSLGSVRVMPDLNGDSRPDLALWRNLTVTTSLLITDLWFSAPGGGFVAGPALLGYYVHEAMDFTGDGVPDLLAHADSLGGGGPYSVVIVPGLGAGAFANPFQSIVLSNSQAPSASRPDVAMTGGDMDGDGDLDAVVSREGEIRVCANQGNGSFVSFNLPYAIGPAGPRYAWIQDVNGDGLLDASVGGFGFWTVALRTPAMVPGNLAASFAAPQSYGISAGAVVDVDADGDLDIISSDASAIGAPVTTAGRIARGLRFLPPSAGQVQQYGAPLSGTAGAEPLLGFAGVARINTVGTLNLTNGLGASAGILGLGVASAATPALGGTFHIAPFLALPINLGGPAGSAGAGGLAIPVTLSSGSQGIDVFLQAGLADPAAPAGISLTSGLRLRPGL